MTGTIVNVGAIVAASLIGSRVKKGIKEEYQGAMFNAMGLAALMLGVHSAAGGMSDSRYPVLFIASLALGSLAGTLLDLDGRFQRIMASFPLPSWGRDFPRRFCCAAWEPCPSWGP